MDNENVNNEDQREIEFNYIKSNNFRVVHADGAIGNGTPSGKLFVVFYNDRFPLPDSQTFIVNQTGQITGEVVENRKVNSNGIMREVEVGVMLDIEVAKGMVLSLSQLIRQTEASAVETENEAEKKQGEIV